MPRINIKGGVWRNTEDEILKAAVMKYGMTQWSRIASLLHRKSAKQCKARWNEWLDPSIKKTEWSRDEEERLLHLAKLLPTQWRTIAPLVGRTAAQCLEHYEYLLDKAAKGLEGEEDEDDEPGLHAKARQLKPGEIDPTPETKPARPDPVDMDEDELEMLSEARARLANTQGKKAKRKAREKRLDEAKRLASLQKRRELRAAGIFQNKMSGWARRQVSFMDYNNEIPFERRPQPGFHDTSEEVFDKKEHNFKKLRRSDLESDLRSQVEERKRREDAMKLKELRDKDMAEYLRRQEKNIKQTTRKRHKLVLPNPLVTDQELDNVVKMGIASQEVRKFDGGTTDRLLGDYDELGGGITPGGRTPAVGGGGQIMGTPAGMTPARLKAMRTPMVPGGDQQENSLMTQAKNLLVLQEATETPLVGGANVPINEVQEKVPIQTPNVVFGKTPKRPGDNDELESSASKKHKKSGGQTEVSATPARDALGMNKPETLVTSQFNFEDDLDNDDFLDGGDLENQLANLPEPKNDFEIVAPEIDESEQVEEDKMEDGEEKTEEQLREQLASMDMDQEAIDARVQEDMEETLEKERLREEAERQAKLEKRHQPIKRDLPRPSIINESVLRPADTDFNSLDQLGYAEELIKQEMIKMMHYDALYYPSDNQIPADSKARTKRKGIVGPETHQAYLRHMPYEDISVDEYKAAKDLIEMESERLKAVSDHGEFDYQHITDECRQQLLFLPKNQRWTRTSLASRRDRLDSCQTRLETNKNIMTKQAKLAAKHEKKLKVLTAGYQSRNNNLTKELEQIGKVLIDTYRDSETFTRMSKTEKMNGEARAVKQKLLFDKQVKRHNELQSEFDTLSHDIKSMMALVQRQHNEMEQYAAAENERIELEKKAKAAKAQLDADLGEEQEAEEIQQEIIEEEEVDDQDGVEVQEGSSEDEQE